MDQLQQSELEHVVMTKLDEIKHFTTYHDDGFTCQGSPMIICQKKLRVLLLFYKRWIMWEEQGSTEEDVL
jgi:hypothetical protein